MSTGKYLLDVQLTLILSVGREATAYCFFLQPLFTCNPAKNLSARKMSFAASCEKELSKLWLLFSLIDQCHPLEI